MLQKAIHDAWLDQQSWASDLGSAAESATYEPGTTSADIGACSTLDIAGAESYWEDNGNGSITLSSMSVPTMSGTTWSAEQFPASGADVIFPVGFTSLQIGASYSFSQPCNEVSEMTGKVVDSGNVSGTGTISQSASNGQLEYNVVYDASNTSLSVSSVTVTNAGNVTVSPNQSNGILQILYSLFDSATMTWAVSNAISDLFSQAGFTTTMIGLINKQIQGGST